jgi:hypothetical protein
MKLVTPYVTTIRPQQAHNISRLGLESYYWSGWTLRQWPWRELRRSDLVYAFDTASRRIRALMQLTRFGAFKYNGWRDFEAHVTEETNWSPNRPDHTIPARGYGICFRWKLREELDFDPGIERFPQLGWLRLSAHGARQAEKPTVRAVPLASAKRKRVLVKSRTHGMRLGEHDVLVRRFLETFRLRPEDTKSLAAGRLMADVYLPSADGGPGVLIEAKGSGSDSEIRTAAGQLADYCWNLVAPKFGRDEAKQTLRVVVAADEPRTNLVTALSKERIAVFWRAGTQFHAGNSSAPSEVRRALSVWRP